ncbi:MAG: NAD(P)H-dependent oxidoreductase [Phycisphaerae bacterium]|nr:NAD(P)H-dependent oxidoreductase [Phycisphaerae bacterium]
MTATPQILAFAGSNRKESFNRKLLHVAAEAAKAAGAHVTVLELRDYPLPIMDQDLEKESGIPENAMKLKKIFIEHQGLVIASPEYNSSVSPLLKNTIDWVSRPVPGEPALAPYQGKVATLLSASSGALGGLRGLVHLRAILSNIGVIVLPEQVALSAAQDAFDADGALKDPKQQSRLEVAVRKLADAVKRFHA